MKLYQKLAMAIENSGMTLREIDAASGVPKSTIQRYISNKTNIPVERLVAICEAIGVKPAWVMGWDDSDVPDTPGGIIDIRSKKYRRVPILGDTAAGEPVYANREYDEYITIPDDGKHYDAALRVAGDSMEPEYHKDDLVFIRYQEDVRDGQIAAVGIGPTVTLKRVYHIPNGLQLLSENHDYPPQTYTIDEDEIHIVGLAVGVLHWTT